MKRAEIFCALAVLFGAGLMIWESTRLVIGWGPSGPGAGFFPFWLSVGLAACAALVLVKGLRSKSSGDPAKDRFVPAGAVPSLLRVFLPMLGAVFLMEIVGFYIASALYLGFSTRWIGRHAWPLVIGVSLLFPLATYLIIERWFLILLPKGYAQISIPF